MKQLTVKERIEKEFGSLNKFVDQNYYNLGMSRTYLYALLNQDRHCNPSIGMLIKLSELTFDILTTGNPSYSDGTIKLVTQNNMTSIALEISNSNTDYSISQIRSWLNDEFLLYAGVSVDAVNDNRILKDRINYAITSMQEIGENELK